MSTPIQDFTLSMGGSELSIDGTPVQTPGCGVSGLYAHFGHLVRSPLATSMSPIAARGRRFPVRTTPGIGTLCRMRAAKGIACPFLPPPQ